MTRTRKLAPVLVLPLLVMTLALTACQKKVTAPVPGSINTLDAYAFRVVSDAQAAIHSVKTWEVCSAANFPATVDVDGASEACDAKAGPFPANAKAPLNDAIRAYNIAAAAGKAYHAGASNDATGLTNAVNQLSQAIANMLSQTGGH